MPYMWTANRGGFRLNKIGIIEGKVKEINSAYQDLQKSINEEQKKRPGL